MEGPVPSLTVANMAGYGYLSIVGTALAYFLWFRGVTVLAPARVTLLALLSPVVAAALGWAVLGQSLSVGQLLGAAAVLAAVLFGASVTRRPTDTPQVGTADQPSTGRSRPRLRPPAPSDTISAMSTPPVYEEKYGFPNDYARLLFVCAAFTLGGLIVPMPWWVRLAETAIFGFGGLALAVLGLRASRLAALRVDESGLTLGGNPLRYATTTQVVPWSQLRAVRLTRESKPPYLSVVTADRKAKAGATVQAGEGMAPRRHPAQ